MPRDTAEVVLKASAKFGAFNGLMSKEEFDKMTRPYYELMAGDIRRQKKRLGGTFAVAHAVATRNGRSLLRNHLGSDLVFIVLNMTKECQHERIKKRHLGKVGKSLENMHKLYEPGEEDEENTFNLSIEEGMTREDVMQKVLAIVKDIK